MDYTATAGVFSASEVGAPHQRKEFTSWPTPTVAEAGKIGKTPYGQKGLSNHPEVIGEVITRPKMNKSRKGEKMNWPTPTTQDTEHPDMELTETGRRKSKDGKSSHSVNLADKVQLNWPTPQVSDMNGATNPNREAHRVQLRDVRRLCKSRPSERQHSWEAPRIIMANTKSSGNRRKPGELVEEKQKVRQEQGLLQSDNASSGEHLANSRAHLAKETNSPSEYNRKTKSMIAVVAKQPNHNLKLNPEWVEQLMGLDIGWTDLGFWATELSRPQQKKHLEFLQTRLMK